MKHINLTSKNPGKSLGRGSTTMPNSKRIKKIMQCLVHSTCPSELKGKDSFGFTWTSMLCLRTGCYIFLSFINCLLLESLSLLAVPTTIGIIFLSLLCSSALGGLGLRVDSPENFALFICTKCRIQFGL
jgi:hypothetical protein